MTLLTLHPFNPLTLKPLFAQEPFYKGKTIRIVVGFSAGGGFDTYARALARHMGKHIAGNPSFSVENMAGAGSLIAANHVYNVAKPDGLTIGHFIGGLFLGQVLGQKGVEFELAGGCWGWDSVKVTWRKALETGDVVIVLQANRKTREDLPKIPQAISLAKTDEARKLIEVGIHGDNEIVRTYTLPPGTPKDRVQILRKAFEDTLKDPEFVAEAKKADLTVNLVPGEEAEKIVSGLFKLDPALITKLKDILYN